MSAPLLPSSSQELDERPFSSLSINEKAALASEVFVSSLPTIFSFMSSFLTQIVSVYYLAKYNDDQMTSGFGLGAMFSNAFGLAWTISFNQATNVFISQAFGAKDYNGCMLFFRRSLVLQAIMFVPIAIGLIFSNKIMTFFGVDPELAEIGGYYGRMCIPYLIGSILYDSMKSFMIGQRVFKPILYIQLTTVALHFLWAKLFIDVYQLGLIGAAICRVLEEWANAGLTYTYIHKSGQFLETWGNWTNNAIYNSTELWKQFKFSCSVAGISYVQWVFFEVQMMIAGTFDAQQVVAHISISNTSSIPFTTTLAIGVTLITFIGNNLGEGKLTKARNYVYASFYLFGIITAVYVIALGALLGPWSRFWSGEYNTQIYLLLVVKAYMCSLLVDGYNNCMTCILKSCGKDKEATLTVLFSLYAIGIPLMITFGFIIDLKVLGIWIAFGISNFVMLGINGKRVYNLDWEGVVKKIREKLDKGETEMVVMH